jgi:CHAT domain-containing protein/tetratricopeptide (TPR) repeat protein
MNTTPEDERGQLERAVERLLARLEAAPDGPEAADAEAQLFAVLDRLYFLLAPSYAWGALGALTEALRRRPPRAAAHIHLLRFYEAQVALNTGRHAEAEALIGASLADPALAPALRARLFNALAVSEMYRSAYPRALRNYGEAHRAAVAAGDLFFQGAALVNMSMVYNDLGDPAEGLRLCRQGLAIFEQIGDEPRQAIARYELGNNALYLGRWDEAREQLDGAVALAQRLGLDARLLNSYWCLGLLELFRGDAAACERYFQLSLERALSPSSGDKRLAADVLWHLGFLAMVRGRLDEALAYHDRAEALGEAVGPHWRSVIGYQRGRVCERRGDLEAAYAAYAGAIATLEDLSQQTDDEQVKIQLLGATTQLYEAMVLLCARRGPSGWAEAFDYVERARSRAFLDSMAHRAPELFATFRQPVATLGELQAALPADAVLLEYFTTGVLPRGEHALARLAAEGSPLLEHLTLPPQLLIFAVTREQILVEVAPLDPNDLPTADDDYMVFKLLQPDMRAFLYDCLLAPVEALLAGRRTLLIVPHGPLHYVPFGALERPDGAPLLSADGPDLATAPSATILLRNALGRPRAATDGLLAVGYNHGSAPSLTYAEAEATLVAQLLGGEALVGPAPKSEALLARAGGARLLHVACHAAYNAVDPLATALQLGGGDALSAQTIIERLRLHCDLVTLSACTSGLSKVVSGDELLGLPRAMLYAGAPAVVCTLWEADDCAALIVSYFLYRGLAAGAGPAAALRSAVTTLRALSGRAVLDLLAGLRSGWPEALGVLRDPPLDAAALDQAPYADPLIWAPFLLIGRPD